MDKLRERAATRNTYIITAYKKPDANGHREIKWRDTIENIVVDEGLNELLTQTFKNGTQSATWYLGLTDGTPTVAPGDTMASHPGWVEVVAYTEANRVTWQSGTVSGGSLDNSANKATFSINANATVTGGAFLTDNNTKGGATGKLYAAGAFTGGDKSLDDGETIDVTATMSVT